MDALRWYLLGSLALVGCSESSFPGGARDGLDTAFPTGDTETGSLTSTTPPAAWYVLDAAFTVVSGTLDPASTTVSAELRDAEGALLCTHLVPVLAAVAAPRPPGERDLLGFWELSLGPGVPDTACEPFEPGTRWIGVSPYDPALDPAVAAAGLTEATAYAGVLREGPTDPVWLVGLAGTEDQLAGYAAPVTGRPLPDGAYRLLGLILLSL